MRNKFKILLPSLEVYEPPEGTFVVMTSGGEFLLVDHSVYYTKMKNLRSVRSTYFRKG